MRILVIGSGGREHALVWRLRQSAAVSEVIASPGNPGILSCAKCSPASTPEEWLRLAIEKKVDLTVVGPEAPLVAGIADLFRAQRLPIVGPSFHSARLEGSKAYSKEFMSRAGIPTARYEIVDTAADAKRALQNFGCPVVLKADGLAAGKGVIVCRTAAEAQTALPILMTQGKRLVVEECLVGEEVSFIVLADGKRAIPLEPTQDHKAVLDDDQGPNTGGMGAYCDSRILTGAQSEYIMDTVIEPTLALLAKDGFPYHGFLYAGLMMTDAGPKVLEFNARLGDPETQPIMMRLESDLADVLAHAGRGDLSGVRLQWKPDPSVCVVMAAHGYPGDVRKGDRIDGVDAAEAAGAVVFQAGTRTAESHVETSGGRVLGVTAGGRTLRDAIANAYAGVEKIRFDGMHYRRDIGVKGLKRWNDAPATQVQ